MLDICFRIRYNVVQSNTPKDDEGKKDALKRLQRVGGRCEPTPCFACIARSGVAQVRGQESGNRRQDSRS